MAFIKSPYWVSVLARGMTTLDATIKEDSSQHYKWEIMLELSLKRDLLKT